MIPKQLCRNLRTKKMFIPALAEGPEAEPHEEFWRSSHCWCNCTLTETGPDDQAVGPERCGPARSCYEE